MIDHLQINDVAPCIHYDCDGVQAAFIYPFAVFKADDLEVWLDKERAVSGYTVSGAGISSGGAVLFAPPPPPGALLTLRRRIPLARVTDFQTDGIIRAKTLNDELDYQVAAVQQVADDVSRCLQRPFTSTSTASLMLPDPVAGRALVWNGDGTGLANSDTDPDDRADAVAAATQAAQAAEQGSQIAQAAQAMAEIACAQARQYRDEAQSTAGGVKVSATDPQAGPLQAKLVAGGNIQLTRTADADGGETLTIAGTVSVPSHVTFAAVLSLHSLAR